MVVPDARSGSRARQLLALVVGTRLAPATEAGQKDIFGKVMMAWAMLVVSAMPIG